MDTVESLLFKKILFWYIKKRTRKLPSIIANATTIDLFHLLKIPINQDILIYKCTLQKHNYILGTKSAFFEVYKDSFSFYTSKKHSFDICSCDYRIEKNELIIAHKEKRYRFSGQCVDQLYGYLCDEEKRGECVSFTSAFVCRYKNVALLLADIIDDCELTKMIGPEDRHTIRSCLDRVCYMVENEHLYRLTLPVVTNYTHEPLSELQRLSEQFVNYKLLARREGSIVPSVIVYMIKSYAIFYHRTQKCYRSVTGDSFVIKKDDYELYVEKSDYETVNLLFITNDYLLIIQNEDVQIRYNKMTIKYKYNSELMVMSKYHKHNIINTKTNIDFYKTQGPIATLTDMKNTFQGSARNSFVDSRLKLQTPDLGSLLYHASISFNITTISGHVDDCFNNRIYKIRGDISKEMVFIDKEEERISLEVVTYPQYYNFSLFTIQLGFNNQREEIEAQECGLLEKAKDLYYINLNREKQNCIQKKYAGGIFVKEDEGWIFCGDE